MHINAYKLKNYFGLKMITRVCLKRSFMYILGLLALSYSVIQAQVNERETGYPFVRNFNPKQYGAHGQNFSIVQDNRGIIYSANFTGVLEYDGSTWRTISLRNNSKASSLAMSNQGRIYAGGRGEFGYLQPDNSGTMLYKSISAKVKKNDILDVNWTFAANEGIYFITENQVYLWQDQKLLSWNSGKKIVSAFYIDGNLYCFLKAQGLTVFQDGSFRSVEGTKSVLPAIEFRVMLQIGEDQYLLGSESQGLYLLSNGEVKKFFTEADEYLFSNKISAGIILNPETYLIGTDRGGIVLISPDGRLVKVFNENIGMQNPNIRSVFVDRDKTIWLATDNGITQVDYPSPLTYFDEKSGFKGAVYSIIRHSGKVYIATYKGLYYLNSSQSTFLSVPGIRTTCWSLITNNSFLLAATSDGIYEVHESNATPVADGFTLTLYASKKDPGKIYAGQTDGLKVLEQSRGKWNLKRYTNIKEEIAAIGEDNDGSLWLETSYKGIIRIDHNSSTHFDTSSGLPSVLGNHINPFSGGLLFSTSDGVLQYNPKNRKFGKSRLNTKLIQNIWLSKIVEDTNGSFWVNSGDETNPSVIRTRNGHYIWDKTALLPAADFVTRTIFPEGNGTVWFGGPDGIIRYDERIPRNYVSNFSSLIRRVILDGDKVLFDGTYFNDKLLPSLSQSSTYIPFIGHDANSIVFEYSAATYSSKAGTQYQVILEGFDQDWSPWSASSRKEYTNLSPGSYTFSVNARNIYGEMSQVSSFSFIIRTPWYAAWWAYPIYGVAFIGILIGLVKLRSGKLEKEKKVLAGIVEERTSEIIKQKMEIENKSIELEEKNDELEKINLIVKSINSEINFSSLLQSILDRMLVIRGIERALVLVLNDQTSQYECKAGFELNIEEIKSKAISLEDIEEYYLKDADEVFEDIFAKNHFSTNGYTGFMAIQKKPESVILLMVKVEKKAEGFLVLENLSEKNAFSSRDISFLKNLKEHIISAFIKTRIMDNLQLTLNNLKEAQTQLIQSEKLASLGQLTAGIAHEIKNPLNFVNNFAALSVDLVKELKEELEKEREKIGDKTAEYISEILTDLENNATKINEHGKRADSIVRGMLLHSRGKSGEMQKANINTLLDEYVNLAYHGFRAQESSFNIKLTKCYDESIGMINVVPQDLSRVFLNLLNNACYSTHEKKKALKEKYDPELIAFTKDHADKIEIRIRDNGKGISQETIEKVFNPFFTTKPAGKGTGLGLSISFDIIVQQHKGEIKVESQEGEYAEFIIMIPKNLK